MTVLGTRRSRRSAPGPRAGRRLRGCAGPPDGRPGHPCGRRHRDALARPHPRGIGLRRAVRRHRPRVLPRRGPTGPPARSATSGSLLTAGSSSWSATGRRTSPAWSRSTGTAHVLPGWPWTQGDTGDPIALAELGPEGSVYVAVRGAQGDPQTYTWTLHRLDANARELAGFPVALPDVPVCGMAVGADGTAYVNCEGEDASTAAGVTTVRAIRPDGSTAGGWPVVLQGGGTINGFRPDGAIVITTVDERGWRIAVIRPDGTSAPGWPRGTPVGSTVAIDGSGRIHVTSHAWSEGQCGPATRTTYNRAAR